MEINKKTQTKCSKSGPTRDLIGALKKMMKTKVESFSGANFHEVRVRIARFLHEKNAKITAMAMAVDPLSDFIHLLITYEEGE